MGRKWGQHFLRSSSVVSKILQSAALTSTDVVVEIGPGEGVLTKHLVEQAGEVHAFEIDQGLAEALVDKGWSGLTVHQGDFLQQDLSFLQGRRVVVVANLPYYITAPILERITWARPLEVKRAVLMMQEEVARRVVGEASREAGALTYIVNAFYQARYLFKVPPGSFSPPPKVDSAVISVEPRDSSEMANDSVAAYEKLVQTAFRARRKQLQKSLRSLHPNSQELLLQGGVDPKRRPETLTVQEFWILARIFSHCE